MGSGLEANKSVDVIEAFLEQLPEGSFRVVSEKWGHEIIQDSYDDYLYFYGDTCGSCRSEAMPNETAERC